MCAQHGYPTSVVECKMRQLRKRGLGAGGDITRTMTDMAGILSHIVALANSVRQAVGGSFEATAQTLKRKCRISPSSTA